MSLAEQYLLRPKLMIQGMVVVVTTVIGVILIVMGRTTGRMMVEGKIMGGKDVAAGAGVGTVNGHGIVIVIVIDIIGGGMTTNIGMMIVERGMGDTTATTAATEMIEGGVRVEKSVGVELEIIGTTTRVEGGGGIVAKANHVLDHDRIRHLLAVAPLDHPDLVPDRPRGGEEMIEEVEVGADPRMRTGVTTMKGIMAGMMVVKETMVMTTEIIHAGNKMMRTKGVPIIEGK